MNMKKYIALMMIMVIVVSSFGFCVTCTEIKGMDGTNEMKATAYLEALDSKSTTFAECSSILKYFLLSEIPTDKTDTVQKLRSIYLKEVYVGEGKTDKILNTEMDMATKYYEHLSNTDKKVNEPNKGFVEKYIYSVCKGEVPAFKKATVENDVLLIYLTKGAGVNLIIDEKNNPFLISDLKYLAKTFELAEYEIKKDQIIGKDASRNIKFEFKGSLEIKEGKIAFGEGVHQVGSIQFEVEQGKSVIYDPVTKTITGEAITINNYGLDGSDLKLNGKFSINADGIIEHTGTSTGQLTATLESGSVKREFLDVSSIEKTATEVKIKSKIINYNGVETYTGQLDYSMKGNEETITSTAKADILSTDRDGYITSINAEAATKQGEKSIKVVKKAGKTTSVKVTKGNCRLNAEKLGLPENINTFKHIDGSFDLIFDDDSLGQEVTVKLNKRSSNIEAYKSAVEYDGKPITVLLTSYERSIDQEKLKEKANNGPVVYLANKNVLLAGQGANCVDGVPYEQQGKFERIAVNQDDVLVAVKRPSMNKQFDKATIICSNKDANGDAVMLGNTLISAKDGKLSIPTKYNEVTSFSQIVTENADGGAKQYDKNKDYGWAVRATYATGRGIAHTWDAFFTTEEELGETSIRVPVKITAPEIQEKDPQEKKDAKKTAKKSSASTAPEKKEAQPKTAKLELGDEATTILEKTYDVPALTVTLKQLSWNQLTSEQQQQYGDFNYYLLAQTYDKTKDSKFENHLNNINARKEQLGQKIGPYRDLPPAIRQIILSETTIESETPNPTIGGFTPSAGAPAGQTPEDKAKADAQHRKEYKKQKTKQYIIYGAVLTGLYLLYNDKQKDKKAAAAANNQARALQAQVEMMKASQQITQVQAAQNQVMQDITKDATYFRVPKEKYAALMEKFTQIQYPIRSATFSKKTMTLKILHLVDGRVLTRGITLTNNQFLEFVEQEILVLDEKME